MAKIKADHSQQDLEQKILDYQSHMSANDALGADSSYRAICDIYQPDRYISTWEGKYGYLYDGHDDFKQDYYRVFITTLQKWKPREERGTSRYGGTGAFKNYFWGSLAHHFINLVKSIEGAAKRNVTQLCPECGQWVNPVSTHIINEHGHVLWDKLANEGLDIHAVSACPFCRSKIYRGKSTLSTNDLIKKHILSKHLYMLFDAFSEKHPSFQGGGVKVSTSDLVSDNACEPGSIYDLTPSPMSLIDGLLDSGLNDVQQAILNNILSKSSAGVKYSADYACTEAEFEQALAGIREKIMILGDVE